MGQGLSEEGYARRRFYAVAFNIRESRYRQTWHISVLISSISIPKPSSIIDALNRSRHTKPESISENRFAAMEIEPPFPSLKSPISD